MVTVVMQFNIIMNEVIRMLSSHCKGGYTMEMREVTTVCYADDVTLIPYNEDDLQKLLFVFHVACK